MTASPDVQIPSPFACCWHRSSLSGGQHAISPLPRVIDLPYPHGTPDSSVSPVAEPQHECHLPDPDPDPASAPVPVSSSSPQKVLSPDLSRAMAVLSSGLSALWLVANAQGKTTDADADADANERRRRQRQRQRWLHQNETPLANGSAFKKQRR
ncbi:hypothetical protein BU24DRAFT_460780 [Aaosphaeria arxii CBS 175.79]|uniref:Uncharacterized protein n=1 Tax=Aaosphaeria arxii CBS 175.79 TaxID=1450172 RepID=A0A6A5XXU7_9PLEO|nr:uncharacterized protein BU24DRAFT_460780 [Aaosphaeria arxii CBS 175.79]KAF2017776.1 hypothetical protein BU24DRAFT_460780 [Aaosphaeria arxii CBS 175.79]